MIPFMTHRKYQNNSTEESKEFFFRYEGNSFRMHREEPERYDEFRKQNLPPELLEEWRQELIRNYFKTLAAQARTNYWINIGNLLEIIGSSSTRVEENLNHLLDEIQDASETLDKKNRILILEHLAGRTASQKDGGIYLIRTKTSLWQKLRVTLTKLSAFSCTEADNEAALGWEDYPKRYREVMARIDKALES